MKLSCPSWISMALCLASLIISCKEQKASNIILEMELKDSVTLQIDKEETVRSGSAFITQYQDEECMLYWEWKQNKVLLFRLAGKNKGTIIEPEALNKTIATLRLDYSFCYYNNDIMLGLSPGFDTVYSFNIHGVVTKKWYLPRDQLKALDITRLTCGLFTTTGYYDEKQKLLYLHNSFNLMEKSVHDFFNYNHFVAIDLSRDTAQVSTFGRFSKGYKREEYQGQTCSDARMVLYSGKILLNFFNSDSIYQYEPATDLKHGYIAHNASGNDFVKSSAVFDTTKEGDRDYINEFAISNERYSFLYSRNNAAYLYRIIDKKYNLYNEDSTFNSSLESPWNIIVMNKDLNIVGEVHIPERNLNRTQFTPYKNGFWIASLTDYRKFYYYEIKLP
jgi:hypothetical protein